MGTLRPMSRGGGVPVGFILRWCAYHNKQRRYNEWQPSQNKAQKKGKTLADGKTAPGSPTVQHLTALVTYRRGLFSSADSNDFIQCQNSVTTQNSILLIAWKRSFKKTTKTNVAFGRENEVVLTASIRPVRCVPGWAATSLSSSMAAWAGFSLYADASDTLAGVSEQTVCGLSVTSLCFHGPAVSVYTAWR